MAERRREISVSALEKALDAIEDSETAPQLREEAEKYVSERTPRAEDRKVYPRSFAAMIGMLGHMQRQLPYEKMRQSTNVVDRSRAQPPPPSLADLVAGQFVPNAEYERRMQLSVAPMDPLAVGAGILDLSRLQSMARRR